MAIPPHVKCCGCCCSLHIGAAIGTGLYIIFMLIFTVIIPATFEIEGVDEAKAFCAGTDDAYRKGNGINSYNDCHGSDICTNDWDEVESAAAAANSYGWAFGLVLLVLLIVTLFLVLKKHAAGLKIVWKLLAVVQALLFLQPIINAAVSNEAGMKQIVGNQFYEMAVKDAFCNGATGMPDGLSKLDMSKGGFCKAISPGESGSGSVAVSDTWKCTFDKDCKEEKWVGAPDKEDNLEGRWGAAVCDGVSVAGAVFPFVWYLVFYLGLLGYLIFHIYSFKEELVKAPSDGTEMGARPAVATAVATAVSTPVAVPTATPAVAVATATPTPVAA